MLYSKRPQKQLQPPKQRTQQSLCLSTITNDELAQTPANLKAYIEQQLARIQQVKQNIENKKAGIQAAFAKMPPEKRKALAGKLAAAGITPDAVTKKMPKLKG